MMKSHKNMARVVAQMLAQDMDAEEMGVGELYFKYLK